MSKINMTVFFCDSITTEHSNYKRIDDIYKTNKYEYYRLARQSKEYDSVIIKDSHFLKEEYNKKLLGIVLYIQQTNDNLIIMKVLDMIKDSYSYTFNYFSKHKYSIDFDDFLKKIVKKHKGIENLTDDEINANFVILHMLSIWNEKNIETNGCFDSYINAINSRYLNDYRVNYNKISCDELIIVEDYYNNFKIKNRASILKYYNNKAVTNMIALSFDTENITTTMFDYIELTKKEIEELIYITMLFDNETNENNIIMLVYFRYMLKSFKEMKEHYFENNKETMFVDINIIQEQLNIANNIITTKDKEIEELKKELSIKDREIKKLKNELKDNKINKSELISLRNNFFDIELEEAKTIQYEIDYDSLSRKKIMVLGGHDTLQSKLKEYLLNSVFISVDNINFDTNLIHSIDKIIVFPNYLNHAIYYKLMNESRKLNKEVLHISNTNINLILKKISE